MKSIIINTRNLHGASMSGVKRYTKEIIQRLPKFEEISPPKNVNSNTGHMWEQLMLPFLLSGKLLWSPANTGPLTVRNQVLTIHDLSVFESNHGFSRRFIEWYKFLLPKLAHRVKKIITDSEFSRERIIEVLKVDPSKVSAIHLGVDKRFNSHPDSSDSDFDFLRNLKLPSNDYILSLGSLEPRKNLSRLLEAWKNILHLIPNEVWLVVAGGEDKSQVFKSINFTELPPRVYMAGKISDEALPALYRRAIALAYPSSYEGFGLPPLEAMACGTPSIAGNLTSLPEVVGNAGILVDPFDVEAISSALVSIVSDRELRQALSRVGLERVKNFTWDATAEQTFNVLNESLG